jgi:YidC/Oxa1 family membrane protein insertase
MDNYRAFLAIVISFVILIVYQFFFAGVPTTKDVELKKQDTAVEQVSPSVLKKETPAAKTVDVQTTKVTPHPKVEEHPARKVVVDTDVYKAVFSERGGTLQSFILKKYKETDKSDSPGKQLIETDPKQGYPLDFTWGTAVDKNTLYTSDKRDVQLNKQENKGQFVMHAVTDSGLSVERKYIFDRDNYLIHLEVKVKNNSNGALQGQPHLLQVNMPFEDSAGKSRYNFTGPAAFLNGKLEEYKSKNITDAPKTIQGTIDWAAYEGTYFICGIMADKDVISSVTMQEQKNDLVHMTVSGKLDTLLPGKEITYNYRLYYGPKKLSTLKKVGNNLDKSINFGWFDVIAKPTLWLLNFLYGFVHNYGVAIIIVTILFKAAFWPITQKGMKSMKNMQKLQPKMAKIKEKYKDDPTRMNKEVMGLYKTYKVNPLGGCLPMVLQIPVFFALYKVLLQCIELRHAPFMLWITDLSAPDRLWVGLHIPYLGGIPVLTLLMGVSMFAQQKLSPTTADPTQAKIMMFLPLVFTVMFVNFASGLVLYWFVNNLLSILQQYLINKQQIKPV